jgi:hypothetical protein
MGTWKARSCLLDLCASIHLEAQPSLCPAHSLDTSECPPQCQMSLLLNDCPESGLALSCAKIQTSDWLVLYSHQEQDEEQMPSHLLGFLRKTTITNMRPWNFASCVSITDAFYLACCYMHSQHSPRTLFKGGTDKCPQISPLMPQPEPSPAVLNVTNLPLPQDLCTFSS